MLSHTYDVIVVDDISEMGSALEKANLREWDKEVAIMNRGIEPTIRRWKPCGPVNFADDKWILPIVRNEG